tara:strand:- start:5862 stop:6092 length:231 start_codon:yes stop_codon:yes gene_type:complete
MDFLPTKEEIKKHFNALNKSYKEMINQGHLKLIEDDKLSNDEYRVSKAIPVTDIGRDFLKLKKKWRSQNGVCERTL